MSTQTATQRISLTDLRRMRAEGERIACLTAYDASLAAVLDGAGVEIVLVGDSLGMVVQGHDTTVPVTVDDMVYHTRAVVRGCRRAMIMADMPFLSYTTPAQALDTAARLMQEGGAQAVKLEGDAVQVEIVDTLAAHGVPVCAHLGLRPQSVHKLGGYRVQGRDSHDAQAILCDARALEEAGADLLVVECIPTLLAAEIRGAVSIPVIGIGAGTRCDGQVLVLQDVLGISPRAPRFAKNFLEGQVSIQAAVRAFVEAVKADTFPGPEHGFE